MLRIRGTVRYSRQGWSPKKETGELYESLLENIEVIQLSQQPLMKLNGNLEIISHHRTLMITTSLMAVKGRRTASYAEQKMMTLRASPRQLTSKRFPLHMARFILYFRHKSQCQEHTKTMHEMAMWVCLTKICLHEFARVEDAMTHWKQEYDEASSQPIA